MAFPCIFCGFHRRKTKEHIWPDWMKTYLRDSGQASHVEGVHNFRWKTNVGSRVSERPGHVSTMKIRVVCQPCNNGWMGDLENQVKTTLVRILNREEFDISIKDQQSLAQWIVLKTIVGEHYSGGESPLTPEEDRAAFRETLQIPGYFAIWIGYQTTPSNSRWYRTSYTISLSREGPNPTLGQTKRNTQSIAFICGPLFVFSFAIRVESIIPSEFFSLPKLARIFPSTDTTLKWPITPALTPVDMGRAAYALDDMKNLPNVKDGGGFP